MHQKEATSVVQVDSCIGEEISGIELELKVPMNAGLEKLNVQITPERDARRELQSKEFIGINELANTFVGLVFNLGGLLILSHQNKYLSFFGRLVGNILLQQPDHRPLRSSPWIRQYSLSPNIQESILTTFHNISIKYFIK